MPDPVNLIPFGGAAARGASLGRRAFLAAREGAVSTLAADAILMPEAVRRGDDVDFGDLALDVTFGALLGGGLGAAGGRCTTGVWRRWKGSERHCKAF